MEPGLLYVSPDPFDAGIPAVLKTDTDRRAELHDVLRSDARTVSAFNAGRTPALPFRSTNGSVASLACFDEKSVTASSGRVQEGGLRMTR